MKPLRKDVRTYLIKDNKIITVRYTTNDFKQDYYDIPGGGIEEGETSEQAAIREFKEESGIDIHNPQYAGNLIVEYPNRIFDIDIFIASEYTGTPKKTLKHIAEWIEIDELLQKEKIFTEIYLLDKHHINDLSKKNNFKFHFIADKKHRLIDEILE